MTAVIWEDGRYGRRAVLQGGWSAPLLALLRSHEVVELELNQGKGWHGIDLSFLADLPELRSFEIFDFTIGDISPIHHLRRLKRLGTTTYCATKIDFATFPELESCDLEWRTGARSLFERTSLKELFVNRYTGRDIAPFTTLVNLERLAILNAPIATLAGLGALTQLRSLRLGGLRRLASLAGIEGLAQLEELEIHTCRAVRSIEEVGELAPLRRLRLNNDGDIASLKPIDRLSGLEWVTFYESTNIVDGDMSPLLRQKNLSRLSFRNRRHYSHRREDFPAYR